MRQYASRRRAYERPSGRPAGQRSYSFGAGMVVGAVIARYLQMTDGHRAPAVVGEALIAVGVFLAMPLALGVDFQIRYGRLFMLPLVLGTCALDVWARRRAKRDAVPDPRT